MARTWPEDVNFRSKASPRFRPWRVSIGSELCKSVACRNGCCCCALKSRAGELVCGADLPARRPAAAASGPFIRSLPLDGLVDVEARRCFPPGSHRQPSSARKRLSRRARSSVSRGPKKGPREEVSAIIKRRTHDSVCKWTRDLGRGKHAQSKRKSTRLAMNKHEPADPSLEIGHQWRRRLGSLVSARVWRLNWSGGRARSI